jgi:hypothetical protein
MKKDQADSTTHLIRAFFTNKTGATLSGLNLQVAVQKYMKLQMFPATSTELTSLSTNQVT